ncbi:MAG: glycosyltransferase family 4 protein [Bryobacteraceae bacterium]|jgi:glycosyltransferase involved in cell wall biosynthesis
MKILHLTLSLGPGGRRTAIFSLIDGLRELGVESDICCLDQVGCAPAELPHVQERVLVLGRRSLFDRAALGQLRAFCLEQNVDVIHTHDAASQFTAALVRFALPHMPLLMTFHRSRDLESATFVDRLRNAFAGSQSAAIITPSKARRTHFLAQNLVPAHKVVRIPLGTDLLQFQPDPEVRAAVRQELGFGPEVTLLGTIGNFVPAKGVEVAIQAFQALAGRPIPHPVALVVVGDGPGRPEIEALASPVRDSPGVVRLAGFRLDINRCMAAIDVLLHTPRIEAFGLVVIEAMATGLPVVATRVGGVPELVREGSTGLLAESEQPESIADALQRLLIDRGLRASMGAEGRRVAVAEYGRELYAKRHLQLYEFLLRSGGSPGGLPLAICD